MQALYGIAARVRKVCNSPSAGHHVGVSGSFPTTAARSCRLGVAPRRFPAAEGENRGHRGHGATGLCRGPVSVAALRGALAVGELREVAGNRGGAVGARPFC